VSAPFDIDTAIDYGTGPARMVALHTAMMVRDGADRLTFGPDRRPGVIGVEVWYLVSGKWYGLVPPPSYVLPKLCRLFQKLAGDENEFCAFRLRGQRFVGQVGVDSAPAGGKVTVDLPLLPALAPAATELLAAHMGPNGLIEFLDSEFT
jgi:hypothetical protein